MPICIVAYIVRVCLGHKWFNNLVAIGGVLLIGGFYLVTNDAMPKEEVLEENEPRGDRIEDGFRRKK